MELFGISLWELLLILVVAVIVLGPNKLPGIARNIGKTIRAIRKAGSDFTAVITKEIESDDTTKTPPETARTHHPTATSHSDTADATPVEKQSHQPEGQPPQDEQH